MWASTTGSNALMIWAVGAAMLVVAILYWTSCLALHLWAAGFAALAAMGMVPADWAVETGVAAHLREEPDPSVIYEDETPYCHVGVRRISEKPDRRAFMLDKLKATKTNEEFFQYMKR